MSELVVVRHVEVRSWPERIDVVVIDQERAVALSHYSLEDVPGWARTDPVFDPLAPFAERCRSALHGLEQDQERLCLQFETPPQFAVSLACTDEPRASLDRLLGTYGLSLEAVELANLAGLVEHLNGLDVERFWELLCDWFDRVERRYPAGTSRQEQAPWTARSHPSRADHFHHMADGDDEVAYEMYREAIDLPLADLTLHVLLQWIYYARTEFAERACPAPAALKP